MVSEVTVRREVLTLALSGPLDERGLKEWAERVKDDLRLLPEISQVSISGTREYEISVEVSEERLREYGITFQQVADAIRRSNLNQAGGTVRTTGEEVRLRTLGRKYWGDEFREIIVLAHPNGDVIKLGQIADLHLRLGHEAEAAEYYREAISYDPADARARRGLSQATDGREGAGGPPVTPAEDLDTLRAQAQALLTGDQGYAEAAARFERILQKAPTDVKSMVLLGQAYEQLGRGEEALA